ncbi:hypothetical protein RHMOL_Rhmol06G0261600 [Rhododendron molle]|uniref:Uncharacterized protein n=1 Tax=Rhododendron molle TaxID=49168 RepID=A0ACC0NGP8_RHOML|nr:hypothetical protein RHMOL_Rhmol06G0261600 [Rhododendron molle]
MAETIGAIFGYGTATNFCPNSSDRDTDNRCHLLVGLGTTYATSHRNLAINRNVERQLQHRVEPMMLVLSRRHLESILVTSFTFAAFLFALPREYEEDGGGGTKSPVPTVVFNTLPPSTFHVFVLSLIFAFSFSLSALLIHDSSSDHNTTSTAANNKISGYFHQLLVNFFGCSSLASIATALAILFRALLLTATEAYYSSSPSSAPTTVLRRSCSNAGAVFIA